MKSIPQISESEYEVMKYIWKEAPVSTTEITRHLTTTTKWNPKTIQTLIKRLVTKEALSYEKQGRVFVYTPLVREEDYVNQESKSFLKRYFNGNLSAMFSTFLENEKISDEEIDSLRQLLEDSTNDNNDK